MSALDYRLYSLLKNSRESYALTRDTVDESYALKGLGFSRAVSATNSKRLQPRRSSVSPETLFFNTVSRRALKARSP